MATKKATKDPEYIARVGMDYMDRTGTRRRVEAGEPCPDLPSHSLPWLLHQGHIEKKEG